MASLMHFFHMGGYAWYVWSAYASVLALLAAQWIIPWRRWQQYLRGQAQSHE